MLKLAATISLVLSLPSLGLGSDLTEDAKLHADDADSGDGFGYSIALDGPVAVIGAVFDEDNGVGSGSAYVLHLTGGQQVHKILPVDGAAGDDFGIAVALDGDLAIVGAFENDDKGSESGSAYIFDTASGAQIAKLLASDGQAGDRFGVSIGASQGIAVIGANGDDDLGPNAGAAYLFDLSPANEIMKLHAPDGSMDDLFGFDVAIDGGRVVVGAYRDDDGGAESGSVYVFDVATGQLLYKLRANDEAAGDRFGYGVSLSGGLALIGAPYADASGDESGAAYVFDLNTGSQIVKLLPSDGVAQDFFGGDVAIDGTYAIVRTIYDDDNGPESGSAYLFNALTGVQLAKLLPTDGASGDRFGQAIAIEGGAAIVGAHRDDDYGADSGSAYVFSLPLPAWQRSSINGHWYHASEALTWIAAEDTAMLWGGHLTTVRNTAENDWLASNFAGDGSPFWIGYNDAAVEGTFVWSSGETPGYKNWRAGEPDDKNGADWAALIPSAGTWLDETFLPERRGVVEVISGDCDGNSLPDVYEAALEPWLDWNGDGVLDSCVSANYCVAENNSTGIPAVIGAEGTPVASENDITLEAWDLPLNEFAYFLASESTAFIPGFGGSSGNLCLGPPQYRFNVPSGGGKILNSGTIGTVSFTLDLNLLPQNITFDPGETWYFQLWYRDFIASGPTSNTTDGIEVMFR